jgi:nucleoid-associated protein YgaU
MIGDSSGPSSPPLGPDSHALEAVPGLSGGPAGDHGAIADAAPRQRVHVVHNGDTLERLAERYLGDGARSLEIFDLNRDLLENPHLLPIGAELRIPADAASAEDN